MLAFIRVCVWFCLFIRMIKPNWLKIKSPERSVHPLCFAPLAVQSDSIINATFFDPCRPSVVRWVICWIHQAIVGMTVTLMIASCIQYSPYNGDVYSPGKRPLCSQCTNRTVVLHAVNFKQLHVRRHAGWAGRHQPCCAATRKVAVNWIQLCYNLPMATCAFFTISQDGNFPTRIVSEISRELYDILTCERCPMLTAVVIC